MEFGVLERLLILNMFKDESDITTMRSIRKLKEMVGFKEDELEKLKFTKNEAGGMEWKNTVLPIEYDIHPTQHALIVDTLKQLSKQKKMSMALLSLYERFEEKD